MIRMWRNRTRALTTALAIVIGLCFVLAQPGVGATQDVVGAGVTVPCAGNDLAHRNGAPLHAGAHCLACFVHCFPIVGPVSPRAIAARAPVAAVPAPAFLVLVATKAPPGWGATWSSRAPPSVS